jgi:hypothetical protein
MGNVSVHSNLQIYAIFSIFLRRLKLAETKEKISKDFFIKKNEVKPWSYIYCPMSHNIKVAALEL